MEFEEILINLRDRIWISREKNPPENVVLFSEDLMDIGSKILELCFSKCDLAPSPDCLSLGERDKMEIGRLTIEKLLSNRVKKIHVSCNPTFNSINRGTVLVFLQNGGEDRIKIS